MSEFQTQCWICPFCFNDSPYMHAECKADDLKMAIEFTKIENEILKKKLEIAIEALKDIRNNNRFCATNHSNTANEVTCGSCKRMLFVLNFDIDERTRHGKKVILK